MNIYGGCCEPVEEYQGNLYNEPFPPIYLNIEGSKLEFLPQQNYGEYKIKSNNKNSVISTQSNKNYEILEKTYQNNLNEINNLNTKINEIEEKIRAMEKILNIDANEKAYVEQEGIKLNQTYTNQTYVNTIEKK